MSRNPTPEEALAYVTALSEHAAIGGIARQAGWEGGAALVESSAVALAELALELGIPLEQASGISPGAALTTTGQLGPKVLELLGRARVAITENATALVKAARRAQGLVLTLGGLYIAHDWATADKQIALAQNEASADFFRENFNKLSPADRSRVVSGYLAANASTPSLGTVAAVVGVAAVGLWALSRGMAAPR